jgi:hypothetical protein
MLKGSDECDQGFMQTREERKVFRSVTEQKIKINLQFKIQTN